MASFILWLAVFFFFLFSPFSLDRKERKGHSSQLSTSEDAGASMMRWDGPLNICSSAYVLPMSGRGRV